MRWRRRCASSSLPCVLELRDLRLELLADPVGGALDRRRRRHVVRRRVDRDLVLARVDLAAERVEVRDRLDLVAEQRDAVRRLGVGRLHLDDVAARAEAAAADDHVVAAVLDVDERAQQLRRGGCSRRPQPHELLLVLARRAEAVDARDRRDDDDVAPRAAARRSRRGAAGRCPRCARSPSRCTCRTAAGTPRAGSSRSTRRSTRPRSREELAELVAELRGERLVVRDHERRLLRRLDDTFAIVNVLPVPVAPSSVWYCMPASTPAASSSIALG